MSGALRALPAFLQLVPPANDCNRTLSASGPNASVALDYTCQIAGGQGRITAEGSAGGVLRARSELRPDADVGLTVPPRQSGVDARLSLGANSRLTSGVTLESSSPTVQAASVGLWFSFDGTFAFERPSTPAPATLTPFASMTLLLLADQDQNGFPGVVCLFGGRPCEADRTTVTSNTSQRTTANGHVELVDGTVLFPSIPVVGTTAAFTVSLSTSASLANAGTTAATYFGGSIGADFSNTVRLAAVQVFDAAGNDVSAAFTARLPTGASVRTGALVTVPEPGTWALMGTGLLAIGGVMARRQRTSV